MSDASFSFFHRVYFFLGGILPLIEIVDQAIMLEIDKQGKS